jgi:hypothetical protein
MPVAPMRRNRGLRADLQRLARIVDRMSIIQEIAAGRLRKLEDHLGPDPDGPAASRPDLRIVPGRARTRREARAAQRRRIAGRSLRLVETGTTVLVAVLLLAGVVWMTPKNQPPATAQPTRRPPRAHHSSGQPGGRSGESAPAVAVQVVSRRRPTSSTMSQPVRKPVSSTSVPATSVPSTTLPSGSTTTTGGVVQDVVSTVSTILDESPLGSDNSSDEPAQTAGLLGLGKQDGGLLSLIR